MKLMVNALNPIIGLCLLLGALLLPTFIKALYTYIIIKYT